MIRSMLALSAAVTLTAALIAPALADDRPQPLRLSAAQLDGVTAGLLVVEATAVAEAHGPGTMTLAETTTAVMRRGGAAIGRASANAVAAGDDGAVYVDTGYATDGMVAVARTTQDQVSGPGFVAAQETLFVVAVAGSGVKGNAAKGRTTGR